MMTARSDLDEVEPVYAVTYESILVERLSDSSGGGSTRSYYDYSNIMVSRISNWEKEKITDLSDSTLFLRYAGMAKGSVNPAWERGVISYESRRYGQKSNEPQSRQNHSDGRKESFNYERRGTYDKIAVHNDRLWRSIGTCSALRECANSLRGEHFCSFCYEGGGDPRLCLFGQ